MKVYVELEPGEDNIKLGNTAIAFIDPSEDIVVKAQLTEKEDSALVRVLIDILNRKAEA